MERYVVNILTLPTPAFILSGGINSDTARDVIAWLMEQRSEKHLSLIINTPGGCTDSGIAIHDAIRNMEANGVDVHIAVLGGCRSAGVVVLCAVKPEHRYASENSDFTIHSVGSTINGKRIAYNIERPAEEELVKEMERLSGHPIDGIFSTRERYVQIVTKATKLSTDRVNTLYNGENYFPAQQALEYGLIGSILDTNGVKPPEPKKGWWRRNK